MLAAKAINAVIRQIKGIIIILPTLITQYLFFLDMVASFGCGLPSTRNPLTTCKQGQTANGHSLTMRVKETASSRGARN
jgi:hypothetical protein